MHFISPNIKSLSLPTCLLIHTYLPWFSTIVCEWHSSDMLCICPSLCLSLPSVHVPSLPTCSTIPLIVTSKSSVSVVREITQLNLFDFFLSHKCSSIRPAQGHTLLQIDTSKMAMQVSPLCLLSYSHLAQILVWQGT